MDAGVWVGALFGVCGTVVGGGLSIWATVIAQRQQAQAARQLVIDQRVDTAVDSAIQMFSQIKQQLLGRPSERESGGPERIELWRKALHQQVHKLEPILLRIRNETVRLRLSKIAEYLAWHDVSMTPELGGASGILTDLCDHALDCLGAFVRDEPLPKESTGLTKARATEALYLEEMEQRARDFLEGYH
ncbi:hypothetical protein [Streptomyces sp. ME19-01-6]|uniref:hypothetical protein n=1 Tax=Streptomyces sp. ME19-01-6 TaxID=3028686 RepID=UPI0029A749B4|nr:hypothetical protein [Streptomyces sp. ME19-01-6]MDX3233221.1 hypothetical protein [Streptomyces sp. ME19-01-6]